MNKKEVAMTSYKFIYIFCSSVLELLPNFFFMARPEWLRFTSEKIDSNSSHRFKNLFSKLNLWLFTATKEWRWGWVNGPVF